MKINPYVRQWGGMGLLVGAAFGPLGAGIGVIIGLLVARIFQQRDRRIRR